jgi:N-acetyl-anhydromuramyl-L-alanine amidase AmpD
MSIPFIAAKNFSKGRGGTKPRLIVIHTMETPESEGRAKQVAIWFGSGTAPQASAHYMIDDTEVIQSVEEEDTAWAVDDWELNQASISLEHAGSATRNAAGWADAYTVAELKLSAALAADIAKRYGIPLVKLAPADILAGKSGFCGHVDITVAKHIAGGHTDPGSSFPWDSYLAQVKANG